MASTNIKANFGKALKKDALIADGLGAAAVVPYIAIPTMLGLEGTEGVIVGVLSCWVIGAAFDMPAIGIAGVGIGTAHYLYSNMKDEIAQILGSEPHNYTGAGIGDDLLPTGKSYQRLSNGKVVEAYSTPTDAASSMSDAYLNPKRGLLNDAYLNPKHSLLNDLMQQQERAY